MSLRSVLPLESLSDSIWSASVGNWKGILIFLSERLQFWFEEDNFRLEILAFVLEWIAGFFTDWFRFFLWLPKNFANFVLEDS